jgi:hypothetical protein
MRAYSIRTYKNRYIHDVVRIMQYRICLYLLACELLPFYMFLMSLCQNTCFYVNCHYVSRGKAINRKHERIREPKICLHRLAADIQQDKLNNGGIFVYDFQF